MSTLELRLDPDRVLADLRELAARTGGPAGARRLAWTADWAAARDFLLERLAELPVTVDRDEAGNLWADLPGERAGFVIVGSHIDAVPSGGWLDGSLGVMTALETLRAIAASGAAPPVGVRLVDWADEEGARFGRSLIGSSACAGTLRPDDLRALRDADGTVQADAMAEHGVDADEIGRVRGRLDGALAYLELHIEQGPVLLGHGWPAAAVSGTVGDERHVVTFTGEAAHAGSTPMATRRDPVAAAARATLAIREVGIAHGGVCTVGALRADPGVVTAIAGSCELLLDQRHLDPETLAAMLADATSACEDAAREFGCEVRPERIFSAAPTPFHPELVAAARTAVADAGGGDHEPVPSGPLHDATEIGRLVPTAMVFAQSDPPISHTAVEDSPEFALRIAIDAFGRTAATAIALAAAGRLTPPDGARHPDPPSTDPARPSDSSSTAA
ncbi:Zn-dependent hydrolase [Patulibacter sp. NPDC049589]|uniref:Zn-dependent hydrolase n=1 Tax=Patulibacter sp. NPDC049589 TaxID=3154731 RepID=UPI003430B5CA